MYVTIMAKRVAKMQMEVKNQFSSTLDYLYSYNPPFEDLETRLKSLFLYVFAEKDDS